MNISKKVFSLAAIILAATGISTANAAEDSGIKNSAILFKVHDINPVKNSDGETIGCDYSVTLYNRSNLIIREASLDLSWADTAITEVIEQEKKEDEANNDRRGRGRSVTERNNSKTISGSVDVPTIRPTTQVTVKSRINSDRCFLLLDDAKVDVRNCDAESVQSKEGRSRSGEANCKNLFTYVSSNDPQYYREFKVISLEEEKSEAEAAKAKQVSETEELYKKAIGAIDSANSVISGIK